MRKKLFFTVNILQKHSPKLNLFLNTKNLSFFLVLFFGIIFGQFQKLDYKFEKLIQESKNVSKNIDGQQKLKSLAKKLNLQENLVVTKSGATTMYSCIVYTSNPTALKRSGFLVQSTLPNFATVLASTDDLQKLSELKDVTSVVAPEFDHIQNDVSRMQSGATLLQDGALNNTNYNGTGVLVGIYDTGIDWKHPDFRDATDQTKSRIVSIWDQTLTKIGTETSPSGFDKGVEYVTAQINDEIDGSPTNFIREKDINGHGTHVAATVAGNGAAIADKRHRGFATNAQIVVVKGGDGSFSQTNTIDALTYFKNVATLYNKPIVVNMSIGGQGSSHDGTAAHEVAVDEFSSSGPGRSVVISAGNDYGLNLHRKVNIDPANTQSFTLNAGGSTSASAVFSFYMYADKLNEVVAKLKTPDGQEYISPPSATTTHSILGGKFTAVVYNWVSSANLKRFVQVIITRNTGTVENSQGTYTISLENTGTTPMVVHGWKVSEGVATPLENGDNEYIVGSPGNATSAITAASYAGRLTWYKSNPSVGGYITPNVIAEDISYFSAQGPRADEVLKPEITASGQQVISAMSSDAMLAASSSSNVDGQYYRINQGTSMSAPGVAGAVALLLQANPNLTASEIKGRITTNARKDAVINNVPNTRWGYGKLDIYKAVADEVGCQTSETESIGYDQQYYTSTQDGTLNATNYVFAVKYTPTLTGKLGEVNFYTGSSTPSNIPITISVRTVKNGNPGEVLGSKTINSLLNDVQRLAWNTVDFSNLGIPVTTGQDFFVTIDASTGLMSMRKENFSVDNRSSYSTDGGTTWNAAPDDYRIRAIVYEDKPQIKKLSDQFQTNMLAVITGKNYITTNCDFIAMVEKLPTSTVDGNITAKVWTANAETSYVSRRYEITPATNAASASGRVTLYFSQAEFDAYNTTNSVKLPTSPTDEAAKENVWIDKYSGVSSDNSGLSSSYSNGFVTLKLGASNVKWNNTYKYWEVTFDTTGFSGFFLRTSSSVLATKTVTPEQVTIYPNPVKGDLNINITGKKGQMKIYDLSGKLLQSQEISKENTINVSQLKKGVYVVEVSVDGKEKVTKKIIKE